MALQGPSPLNLQQQSLCCQATRLWLNHQPDAPPTKCGCTSGWWSGQAIPGAQAGLKALCTCTSWYAYAAMSGSSTRSLV